MLIPGDGTTVGQVGHVDDEARALRMMAGRSVTFGRRYNLTGGDMFSDEGYVDTFARVVGVEPEKLFLPAAWMDDLYAGRMSLSGRPLAGEHRHAPAGFDDRAAALFGVQRILQRLAPNLHHWNRSVFFSIERLRRDVGWEPEYTFPAAVAQTWEWMQSSGLDRTRDFDFGFEDDLIARLRSRCRMARPWRTSGRSKRALTAPGGMFEVVTEDVRGAPMRVFKNRTRSLRALLEASRAHGDKEYIVYADERVTLRAALRARVGVRARAARALRRRAGRPRRDPRREPARVGDRVLGHGERRAAWSRR